MEAEDNNFVDHPDDFLSVQGQVHIDIKAEDELTASLFN
jgi:hypothetical protein